MTAKRSKRRVNAKRILIASVGAVLLVLCGVVWQFALRANLRTSDKAYTLYVPTGASYDQVLARLNEAGVLRDEFTFSSVAQWTDYPKYVKPGRYVLEDGLGNWALLRRLRNGLQNPIRLMFTTERTSKDLFEGFGKQLELPADSFMRAAADTALLRTLGFNKQTLLAMFIPNSYEVYWTVRPRTLLRRMKQEYDGFWNADRKAKAEQLQLTPLQVSILASIVEAESYRKDERPRIAGVYLNRLRKNMLLQADPTVIFGVGDFSIKRVLKRHLEHDSPYNTYKYTGLPPGPINSPSISSIDAVLNAETHNYIYFVAKADFSGYHTFSENLAAHERSAYAYRAALLEEQRKARQK